MKEVKEEQKIRRDGERRTGATRVPCDPAEALSCLLAVTQELNATADIKAGLARVAGLVRNYVPYETFAVLLLDDLGRELSFAHAEGFDLSVTEHWRFGMGQGIVGIAAEERRTVLVEDVARDPRYIQAGDNVRSELAIPLIAKGRTVGVLDIGAAETRFFTHEDQRLLGFLADHLAGAIEAARLYQNMWEQSRNLSLLHEVSRELTSILDREHLLERVAERVQRLIEHDQFTLFLWNDQSQRLEPSISISRDGTQNRGAGNLALGIGISGTAAALRQPVRVPNVRIDPRYVDCSVGTEVNSELAVPLIFKDRLIGVLDLESSRFNAFTTHHQQLLSTLGSSLAIALENARLYERLQRDERKLETDLSTARQVQKQLLPKTTPWIPGLQVGVAYEPARHLGGDFYDFLPYGEGQVAIAVGDVAGKATSAALFGSLAIGMLREYAVETRLAPGRILAEMNRKLGHLGFDSRFLAMLFAVYDRATRRLTIANSGLPHPYLLRGRSLRKIEIGGVPLGLLPDRRYDEAVIELGEDEAVVFASDGVEDSLNERDEEFGLKRIEGTLQRLASESAGKISEGLLEATRLHAGHAEAYDDRTIVVLKSTPEIVRG